MRKMKTQFTDSYYELKDLKTLSAAAMLLAITVVLGFYRLQLTDYLLWQRNLLVCYLAR